MRFEVLAVLTCLLVGCARRDSAPPAEADPAPTPPVAADTTSPPAPAAAEPHPRAALYDAAATAAWQQFEKLWDPKTGLARATLDYDKVTPWDIASVLAANYSAHKLGLLAEADYDKRVRTTLATLQKLPLYRGAVFNKSYISSTGRMAGRGGAVSARGYGWSATDLGRLLIWLHLVGEEDAQHKAMAAAVVKRIKFPITTTTDGYMRGGMDGSRGQLWQFQEGRIGYEQYAARGFAFWGVDVSNALDVKKHARPINVLGVDLLADTRGLDRLTSEPFVLLGMEVGFTPEMKELAQNVLAAQEARFRQTGKMTMVSEDAVNVKPHYFYYYCVYCNGRSFTVDVVTPGSNLDQPRWVSTKATFGYDALMPSEYTDTVMKFVSAARTSRGWSSGVFERNRQSTNAYDINTAAVVLEAALYVKQRRPFAQSAQSPSGLH
jgi:hypothetical protein